MTYEEISNIQLTLPEATFEDFKKLADQEINNFLENNLVISKLDDGLLSMEAYHNLLLTLFHQVYMSSTSFALAGSMVNFQQFKVRDYLMEHAEEEKEHWGWIINDLRNTGYEGPDPRESFPSLATQSYIGFAMFLATKFPVGRLAMGYILESLSGKFGVLYGSKVGALLNLQRNQVEFFVKHGELDQGHSDDILDVLKEVDLSAYDWAYCCYVAKTTVSLYKAMYNEAIESKNPLLV